MSDREVWLRTYWAILQGMWANPDSSVDLSPVEVAYRTDAHMDLFQRRGFVTDKLEEK